MNMIHRTLLLLFCVTSEIIYTDLPPLGLFVPYDINIKQKKSQVNSIQTIFLGENSYTSHGYATDSKEEITYVVDVLQIYEPVQNVVALYQGPSGLNSATTPFTQLLDSIAGGAGGGVSNLGDGLFQPTGKLSCGQFSLGATYGCGQNFYISAYLPFYFAKLSNVCWTYLGNNNLFSGAQIQEKLIDAFAADALQYFDLNIGNWNRKGLGDLAVIAEWQRDFPQRRPTLKNVQVNGRLGITFPTALQNCQNIIMPINFGADGAIGLPFGAGLNMFLGDIIEVGFSGQFWYYWSNQKIRRIKTFPTQTTLLEPILTNTYKQYSIIQNFNLTASVYTPCQRFSIKGLYQYWRKGMDTLIPLSYDFNFDIVNTSRSLDEVTRHQFTIFGAYSPRPNDFKKSIPQAEIFWKCSTNGMRTAIAGTYGAQLSLTF